jgi:hypothetical protein
MTIANLGTRRRTPGTGAPTLDALTEPGPPLPRFAVLGLAGLTVALVGVLSLALFRDDLVIGDEEDADAPASEVAPPEGDDFERPDAATLADDDHAWTLVSGAWIIQDAHAAITTAGPDGLPGLARLPADAADGHLEVTATAVEPGWGLAFRVAGPDDLWAVVARPDRGTWSLVQIAAGELVETEDVLALPPVDGAVVAVDLAGPRIRVTVDGVTAEVVDAPVSDAGDVGLLALPPGNLTSMAWDDLQVTGT